MQNFTTTKDAQIVDVSGLVQTESAQNAVLQRGESIPSGTVLTFAEGSEITLIFEDGTEQTITGAPDETLAINDQTTQQTSAAAITEAQNATADAAIPTDVQADIEAIQGSIESGDDIDLPDTAAGGLTGNEGTDFVTLDRDGNELLAGAGVDTAELDNPAAPTEDPELFARGSQPTLTQSDANVVEEDTTASGNVLDNDSDADDVLSVQSFTVAGDPARYLAGQTAIVEGGSLIVSQDGSYSFVPAENFNGDVPVVTYTTNTNASDTLSIIVTPVNEAATVSSETKAVSEGNLATDLNTNGKLTITDVDSAQTVTWTDSELVGTYGTFTVAADGTWSYAGNDAHNELNVNDTVSDEITVTSADGTATGVIKVNITGTNDAPVAEDDSFSVNEGNTTALYNVILNSGGTDTDGGDGGFLKVTHIDGNPISGDAIFTIIDGVISTATAAEVLLDATFSGSQDNGILRINEDGQFTYENKGFLAGSPAPTFEYTLSDGIDTDTAEVTINVNTNAPDAVADTNYIGFIMIDGIAYAPPVVGNVVTGFKTVENPDGTGSSGDMPDSGGGDDFGSPILTTIVYAGILYPLDAHPSGSPLEIKTNYGTLEIDNMGVYTFIPAQIKISDPNLSPEELLADGTLDLKFAYTIQDSDSLNPDTDSAILTINVAAPFVPPAEPLEKSIDTDFNQTSGLIDTDFDAKAFLNVEDPASKYSPDLDDLSDILTDEHAGGLENYLAVMSKDDGAISEDVVVLEKGEADLEPESFTTITNGLLADGAILISDATATNAPIAELDSSELL